MATNRLLGSGMEKSLSSEKQQAKVFNSIFYIEVLLLLFNYQILLRILTVNLDGGQKESYCVWSCIYFGSYLSHLFWWRKRNCSIVTILNVSLYLSLVLTSKEKNHLFIHINEIRELIGPISSKFPVLCSDASILRYLRARNWNTKKARKMLKETLKWRLEYKPEKIRWEDVAHEAKNGKLYIANYFDKSGRTVLIMRPGFQVPEQQSAGSTEGQIKYLIYCMEKAIADLKPDQEQMVWLIDFQGWNMSSISVKLTRETAHVLQDHYPERLGLAILYNPPKLFESFWLMVKPFIEPRTHKKVKFVFSDDPQGQKIMDEQFDMEKLESVFGGRNSIGFDFQTYAKRMEDEDKKATDCVNSECSSPHLPTTISESSQQSEISGPDLASEASDEGDSSSNDETASSNWGVVDEKIKGTDPPISCNDQCGKNVLS